MGYKCIRIFILFSIVLYGQEAAAQDSVFVTGIVTTAGKFSLDKVRIMTSKSEKIVYSDSSGLFNVACTDKDVLLFSASGFHDKKVRPGKQKNYKIDLAFLDSEAAFNSAIENGHISESDLHKAIQARKERNVKDYSKYTSIFELIASEIYDVRVTGNVVYIKETRTMGSPPPVLYVVDDLITSDISHISPLYVKSIEFIDDAGAALWGSKGASGVLRIYLK